MSDYAWLMFPETHTFVGLGKPGRLQPDAAHGIESFQPKGQEVAWRDQCFRLVFWRALTLHANSVMRVCLSPEFGQLLASPEWQPSAALGGEGSPNVPPGELLADLPKRWSWPVERLARDVAHEIVLLAERAQVAFRFGLTQVQSSGEIRPAYDCNGRIRICSDQDARTTALFKFVAHHGLDEIAIVAHRDAATIPDGFRVIGDDDTIGYRDYATGWAGFAVRTRRMARDSSG